MGLDIRTPIGLMFAILGALLLAYGLASDPALYARSLGLNVNAIWGGVLLVFGGTMLALGRRGTAARSPRLPEERHERLIVRHARAARRRRRLPHRPRLVDDRPLLRHPRLRRLVGRSEEQGHRDRLLPGRPQPQLVDHRGV